MRTIFPVLLNVQDYLWPFSWSSKLISHFIMAQIQSVLSFTRLHGTKMGVSIWKTASFQLVFPRPTIP
jgi:hypothetical protein